MGYLFNTIINDNGRRVNSKCNTGTITVTGPPFSHSIRFTGIHFYEIRWIFLDIISCGTSHPNPNPNAPSFPPFHLSNPQQRQDYDFRPAPAPASAPIPAPAEGGRGACGCGVGGISHIDPPSSFASPSSLCSVCVVERDACVGLGRAEPAWTGTGIVPLVVPVVIPDLGGAGAGAWGPDWDCGRSGVEPLPVGAG